MAKESLYAHAQKIMNKKKDDKETGKTPRPSDSRSSNRDGSEASQEKQSLYSHAQKFVTKREEYKPSAEYQRLRQRPIQQRSVTPSAYEDAAARLLSGNNAGKAKFGNSWDRYLELSQKSALTPEEKSEAKAARKNIESVYGAAGKYQQDLLLTDIPQEVMNVYRDLGLKADAATGVATGFLDALGVDWLSDKVADAMHSDSPRMQSQLARAKAAQGTAFGVGNVAGNLYSMLGINQLVGAGAKAVPALSKLPKYAQTAIKGAATYGIKGAYSGLTNTQTKEEWDRRQQLAAEYYAEQGIDYQPIEYSAWQQVGNIAQSFGLGALSGAAGSVAGDFVGDLGKAVLVKLGWQKPLAEVIRQALASTAHAGASTASTYWLYPEESRPNKEKIVQDLALSFLFSAATATISTIQVSKQNKEFLNGAINKMRNDYQTILNSDMSKETQLAGMDEILKYNQTIRSALSQNYYAGQQSTINELIRSMDAIDEQINIIKNGVTEGTATSSPASSPNGINVPSGYLPGDSLRKAAEEAAGLSPTPPSPSAPIAPVEPPKVSASDIIPPVVTAETKPVATVLNDVNEPPIDNTEAHDNTLAIVEETGKNNTPYDVVLNIVNSSIDNNIVTADEVRSRYEQGLAAYNKTTPPAKADTGGNNAVTDISAFEEAGFKHWQKDDKDRLYISVSKLGLSDEVKDTKGRVKVWLDVPTGEVQATKDTPASVIEAAQKLVDSVQGKADVAENIRAMEEPPVPGSNIAQALEHISRIKHDGLIYSVSGQSDGYYVSITRDDSMMGGMVSNARSTIYRGGPFATRKEAVADIAGVYDNNFANNTGSSATPALQAEAAPATMTLEEQGAIRQYKSGSDSYILNEKLYSGAALSESEKKLADNLDKALDKLPNYKGTTYRVLSFDRQGKEAYDAFIARHVPDMPVNYGAYTSSSKTLDGYDIDCALKVKIEIDGFSGKDVSQGFGLETENEVLYGRTVDYITKSVETTQDGVTVIKIKEANLNDEGILAGREKSVDGSAQGQNTQVRAVQEVEGSKRAEQAGVRGVPERDTQSGIQGGSGSLQGELSGGQRNARNTEGELGGQTHGSTQKRSDEGVYEGQNASAPLRGDGREVLPGVLQTELPVSGGEGAGARLSVLREAGNEGTQRADRNDAAGSSRGRSLGNRQGVAVPEGRGEHEVGLEQEAKAEIERTVTEKPKGANFVIGEKLDLPAGEKARYKANVAAIKIVKNLIVENRYATAEEQEALSKYVGWGGLSSVFDAKKEGWAKEYNELQALLTPEEYKSARASTLNAHYTSIDVIRAMYEGLKHLGFQGGRMLEPSGGIGHFMGAMPADMQGTVKSWTMVELDDITGHIAKYLYPNSDVRIEGFEKAKIPNNYMDVAIGNVPFGNYAITDKAYPGTVTSAIHNYFFAKSLDKVRPGGLVTFITSRYTMDAYDDRVRKYLMDNADLLGAIRLPDTAFKGNAGTEVVTDIIVLRKRAAFTPYKGEAFGSAKYTLIGKSGTYINEYFADHPEMVLGTPEMTGSMYGKDGLTYKALKGDLNKQIISAFNSITGKMEYPKRPTVEKVNRDAAIAEAKGKEGSLVAKGSKIYKINDGQLVEHKTTEKQAAITAKILSIRDTARGLLNMQLQSASEMDIKAARSKLNKAYDAFVKQHGFINAPGNKRLYSDDVDAPFITSLESYDAKEKVGHKADIFSKNTVSPRKTVTHTDNAIDALIVSVNETGGVDMQRIAELTGNSVDAVSRELLDAELVYKNRDGAYETAEQYLSGNVKAKLRDAEDLLPADKDYQRNIDALKKIIPEDIPYQDIFVQPGSTWVPQSVYSEFVSHMLNVYNGGYRPKFKVSYSALTGDYIVQLIDSYVKRSVENTGTWGTADKSFADLFSALLNNRRIVVSRKDAEGRSYVDKAATIAAQEKAEAIKAEFQNWIWEDEARRDTLAHLYNETFNNTVTPKYNGANLTVDGISAAKPLRAHQKDVVQRIISSGGNTLIAHKVGAGKTAEMAAAAMKLRQLGVVKKPMFVVPKSVLAQWGQEFISFFPNAKILLPGDQDFTAKRRREFMNKVATGDYDAIIVSQENFSSIPVSADTEYQFTIQQLTELEAGIEMAVRNGQRNDPSVKQMEKKKKQFEARLEKLNSLRKDEGNISFEELGVDSLFVDEAHSYKNLFYTTNMNNVSGLGNKEGAKRSYDLYMKVRYLQQLNEGRGIVFATATPVMNSMSEMYIMQKYLQSDLLRQRGLETFDAWANMFGEVVTVMEMNPTGKGYRQKESFSRFKNLGELQQMFRSFADVLTDVPGLEIPRLKGGKRTVVVSPASQYQLDYIEQLAERADKLRGGSIDPKADNMLKITSEGRKLSYSQHIMDPSLPYEEDGKIMKCISNVYDIWKRTKKDKMAQLVFCDIATPKGGQQAEAAVSAEDAENVSIYDDMKRQLVLRGIPAKEIAFIHDADTQDKKNQLFDDVNDGKVRVLIGSTGKMGVGMNAQKRLYALHHLDAPWRPGDIEQREGRILRQGNINKEVEIFTYVTEKTFDARMWDNLERKASFINSIMNGDANAREAEDVGEMVLSFAEIKSIASGNPLIMEQFEVNAEITKLTTLKRQHSKAVQEAKFRKSDTESAIATAKNALPKIQKDIAARKDISGDNFTATVSGTTFTDRKKAGEAIISASKKFIKDGDTEAQRAIGKIAGFDLLVNRNGNVVIRGESTYTATVNPESAVGTIQSIEAVLRSIETRAQQLEASISAWQADIAKLDSIISTPFERQSDLNKAIARNNEITNILNPPEAEAVVADYNDADTDTIQSMVGDSPDDSDVPHDKWNTQRVGSNSKTTMRISDIIGKMRHDFGIPVGTGRMSRRDVLGQYNTHAHSIKTRIANDLPTVAHELGHHLDNVYHITKGLSKEQQAELVDQLSSAMREKYKPGELKAEGLAEFVRRYMQNKETARIDYPLFFPHFQAALSPETLATVDGFADEINAYYSLDAGTAQSSIRPMSEGPNDFRTLSEKFSDSKERFYQDWFDSLHAIRMFDKEAGSSVYIDAINSAYSDSIAASVLFTGYVDDDGRRISGGLQSALDGIDLKDKKTYADFNEYLVVRHGPERLQEGMRIFADDRKNSTSWMDTRRNELERQHPEFSEAAEKLYTWQRDFLHNWGVKYGLVSKVSAEEWAERWSSYVPLNRVMDKGRVRGGAKRSFANQDSTIRRAHGSGRDIVNPVESIITNTVKMVNAAIKNKVALDLVDAAKKEEGLGWLVEPGTPPMKRQVIDMAGTKQALEKGIQESSMDEDAKETAYGIVGELDDYLVQFSRGTKGFGNTITVLRNGKPEFWKINDPMLLESLTNMSPRQAGDFARTIGTINRLITNSITGLNLVWSVGSNTVRDLGTAFTYSEKSPIKLVKEIFASYAQNFRKPDKWSPFHKEYVALGGGHDSAFATDKDMPDQIIGQMTGDFWKLIGRDPAKIAPRLFNNTIGTGIEFVSDIIESGPREAIYVLSRKSGLSPREAMYASHDITVNFKRGGVKSKQLNRFVPFFNAGMQGLDKEVRFFTAEDAPPELKKKVIAARLALYIGAYTALGALQWLINSRDEKSRKYYAQLSTYTKNNFWCIPVYKDGEATGEFITIPKPRELAAPASATSALLEKYASGNDDAFRDFDEYLTGSFLPNLADDAAQGLIDLLRGEATPKDVGADLLGNFGIAGIAAYMMANRDFLGRPIESAAYTGEKATHYNERTSKIAKVVGEAFNWSPIMIDYFGKNVFGGFWKFQQALFPVNDEARDFSLGLKNTYWRDSQYSTDLINTMYSLRDAAKTAKDTYPADMDKAIAYSESNTMTTFYSRYNKLAKDNPNRNTRQIVLDMINDFNRFFGSDVRSYAQQKVDAAVRKAGDTEIMPNVMQTFITDDSSKRFELTAEQYVEYQGKFNNLYWQYVTAVADQGEVAIRQAKKRAKNEADAYMLKLLGGHSKAGVAYAAQSSAGISASDDLLYQAALDVAREGGLKKQEVYDVLDRMSIPDSQKAVLFDGTGNYSGASNIYYTADELNSWIYEQQREGRKDGDIAKSISNVYRELYQAAYEVADYQKMSDIETKLFALDLTDKKGKPYWTQKKFDEWLKPK